MIYIPESVNEIPVEAVCPWKIYEVDDGKHHLVGHCLRTNDGRASSSIQKFDPKKRTITTRSGRIYQLIGNPGSTTDSRYVWETFKQMNNIKNTKDVSKQYYKEMK